MSTKYVLTVTVPDQRTFESYWYGTGRIISFEDISTGGYHGEQVRYIVDYGSDKFRAEYQAGRFASGLHFAKVDEVKE